MNLWRNIGGCVPMNASQYFRNIINKAQELKIPADLTGVENKTIQQSTLKNQFYRLNPRLQKESIQFNCMASSRGKAVLTNIQVCYRVNGQYKQCGNSQASNCPNSFMIQGSYCFIFASPFIFPIRLLLNFISFSMHPWNDWSTIFRVYDY